MPTSSRYAPDAFPPAELVERLRQSRERGISFDAAWAGAMRRPFVWPTSKEPRDCWKAVLAMDDVKEEYRCAYELRPTPLSQAVSRISEPHDEQDLLAIAELDELAMAA